MKNIAAITLCAFILTACGHKDDSATADDTAATATPAPSETVPGPDETPPAPDQTFFDTAAEGGMAEVEAGTLAQDKASSSEVKKFAAMMVKDHTAANEKLKGIAGQTGVMLPADLNAEHKDMKATLEGLSGKDFDKEYMRGQIKDHEALAELLRTESEGGLNADAKAFAAEILPTVEAHLKKAKDLGKKLGVDAMSTP